MFKHRAHEPTDRGGGILLVILLGGLVSAVGLGLVAMSSTERAVAANYQAGIQLLYAAESLADRIVGELSVQSDWGPALAASRQSTLLDASLRPVTPWGEPLDLVALTALLQQQTEGDPGPNTPRWRLYACGSFAELTGTSSAAHVFVVAWVADDEADGDADPTADSNGLIVLRAEARGMGGLRRAVQVVVGGAPPALPGEVDPPAPDVSAVRVVAWREVR